jgi:hypothetical protein
MVDEISSATMFFVVGIGSLVVSCVLLLLWFKRSGYF